MGQCVSKKASSLNSPATTPTSETYQFQVRMSEEDNPTVGKTKFGRFLTMIRGTNNKKPTTNPNAQPADRAKKPSLYRVADKELTPKPMEKTIKSSKKPPVPSHIVSRKSVSFSEGVKSGDKGVLLLPVKVMGAKGSKIVPGNSNNPNTPIFPIVQKTEIKQVSYCFTKCQNNVVNSPKSGQDELKKRKEERELMRRQFFSESKINNKSPKVCRIVPQGAVKLNRDLINTSVVKPIDAKIITKVNLNCDKVVGPKESPKPLPKLNTRPLIKSPATPVQKPMVKKPEKTTPFYTMLYTTPPVRYNYEPKINSKFCDNRLTSSQVFDKNEDKVGIKGINCSKIEDKGVKGGCSEGGFNRKILDEIVVQKSPKMSPKIREKVKESKPTPVTSSTSSIYEENDEDYLIDDEISDQPELTLTFKNNQDFSSSQSSLLDVDSLEDILDNDRPPPPPPTSAKDELIEDLKQEIASLKSSLNLLKSLLPDLKGRDEGTQTDFACFCDLSEKEDNSLKGRDRCTSGRQSFRIKNGLTTNKRSFHKS